MKIAFCIPDMIIGGVEAVLLRTLNELLDTVKENPKYAGAEICVITHAQITEPLYSQWFKQHPEVKLYTFYPLQNYFESMIAYTDFVFVRQVRKLIFSLYKKCRRLSFRNKFSDIDVFIDYKNCSFFKELRDYKTRKITWIHGSIGYLQDNNIDNRLPMYDNIVGLTDDFVSDFKKIFPDLADRVVRIYNPIDINFIRNLSKDAPRTSGKYFCHVSRLESLQKDVRTLIAAFNEFYLDNGLPDIKLLIVGDGPQIKELKKMVSLLPSSNNIVFTGLARNPFGYMENALANILSSKSEGLPTVLVESMALGVLCIASNCKYGPHEILQDGKSGVLFEVGNVKQLAQIMSDVYNGKIDVSSITQSATESLERFSPKVINKQIMDLLWK